MACLSATVGLGELCDGVEATLSVADGMQSSVSYNELTEGIPAFDCPQIQVFPESGGCDRATGTDRTATNSGVQQSEIVVYVNLYARLRSQVAEDMKATVDLIDAIISVLQEQEKPPFFGVSEIKNFKWSWRRAVMRYMDERYMGARFTLYLRVF